MKQIRMRWVINGRVGCGEWMEDTPENRKLLDILIRNGRQFGVHHMQGRVAASLNTPESAKRLHRLLSPSD